jgi:hypothetical protein
VVIGVLRVSRFPLANFGPNWRELLRWATVLLRCY